MRQTWQRTMSAIFLAVLGLCEGFAIKGCVLAPGGRGGLQRLLPITVEMWTATRCQKQTLPLPRTRTANRMSFAFKAQMAAGNATCAGI